MTTTMRPEPEHRVREAIRHAHPIRRVEDALHDHSPMRRFTVEFDHLECDLCKEEILEQLQDHLR
jgi:hypothetical protein